MKKYKPSENILASRKTRPASKASFSSWTFTKNHFTTRLASRNHCIIKVLKDVQVDKPCCYSGDRSGRCCRLSFAWQPASRAWDARERSCGLLLRVALVLRFVRRHVVACLVACSRNCWMTAPPPMGKTAPASLVCRRPSHSLRSLA